MSDKYDNSRILIKNLPITLDANRVEKLIQEKCKDIGLTYCDCKVLTKKKTINKEVKDVFRGLCFIGFINNDDATRFLEHYNGTYFRSCKVTIEYSKPPIKDIQTQKNPSEIISKNVINTNNQSLTIITTKNNRITKAGMASKKQHIIYNDDNDSSEDESQTEDTDTKGPTSVPLAVPPEVTTTVGLADSSSNYLSPKSIATPRDRGEDEVVDGMKSSTRPQVEPVADLREAKGEINKESRHGEWKERTSGVIDDISMNLEDIGRVVVFNLPYTITEGIIRDLCKPYGPVVDIHIPMKNINDIDDDRMTKGYCYITWVFPSDAIKFRDDKNRTIFCGRIIHVEIAIPKINNKSQLTYNEITDRILNKKKSTSSYKIQLEKKEKKILIIPIFGIHFI